MWYARRGLAELEQKRIGESYLCTHSDGGGEGNTELDPECCPGTERGDGNSPHTGNPTSNLRKSYPTPLRPPKSSVKQPESTVPETF